MLSEKHIAYRELALDLLVNENEKEKERNTTSRSSRSSRSKGVRESLQEYTGRRTVPQVFIGGECIGGADELVVLEEKGDLEKLVVKAEEKQSKALPDEVEAFLPKKQELQDLEKLQELKKEGEGKRDWVRHEELLSYEERVKRRLARDYVGLTLTPELVDEVICKELAVNKQDAARIREELLANRILLVSSSSSSTGRSSSVAVESSSVSYTFPTKYPSDEVFNGQMLWPFGAPRPASQVAESLRLKILNLYESYLSPDGNAVDYENLGKSEEFKDYVRSTAELREVDLNPLSREEKIAFFVNIYNALVVHATAAVGAPTNIVKRLQFFSRIKYCIGGQLYSCDDIEHGILRNNAVSPGSIFALVGLSCLASRTFPAGDPREAFVVEPVDPRIHFALVCGAKSCPPIRLYSASNLEEGLAGAAEAFCESEVQLSDDKQTVTLSKIFKWYGKDFASKKVDLLRRIAGYQQGEELKQLLDSNPKGLKIKYAEYNWDVNSK